GIAENGLGNTAAADRHFRRALGLNPDHPATHLYYARWLIRQGRTGEAIPHLERTLELSPADVDARHMLMSVYAARGAPELDRLALATLSLASTDTIAAHYARREPPFHPAAPGAKAWYDLGREFGADQRH